MSIDFKPAVRFLKLDKMGAKCAEVGKNIAAFAKRHPEDAVLCTVLVAALAPLSPSGAVIIGSALLYSLNGAGKFDRLRDENAASVQPGASQLSR